MKNNFVPPGPLITHVLFLIFNRPDTTQQVFDAIKQAKPKQLFVAADGPRKDKEDEKEKCEQARKIIEQVDWDCEVKTLFRDKNLGCKISVSSAIDWFFENVEEGIILEDDCLPNQSFFWFCQELLGRYREDTRVWQISAFNPMVKMDIKTDFVFSKYGPCWGWATWQRAWRHYDVQIKKWKALRDSEDYLSFCEFKGEKEWRFNLFEKLYNGKIESWAYQWSFTKHINSGLSIIPKVNMIKNIGFNIDATHTKSGSFNYQQFENIVNNYPENIMRCILFDEYYFNNFAMKRENILKRVGRVFLKKFLKKNGIKL